MCSLHFDIRNSLWNCIYMQTSLHTTTKTVTRSITQATNQGGLGGSQPLSCETPDCASVTTGRSGNQSHVLLWTLVSRVKTTVSLVLQVKWKVTIFTFFSWLLIITMEMSFFYQPTQTVFPLQETMAAFPISTFLLWSNTKIWYRYSKRLFFIKGLVLLFACLHVSCSCRHYVFRLSIRMSAPFSSTPPWNFYKFVINVHSGSRMNW